MTDSSKIPYDPITARRDNIVGFVKRNGYIKLTLDFRKFSADPTLFLFRGSTQTEVKIELDFSDWNVTQEFITIKDGIISLTYK